MQDRYAGDIGDFAKLGLLRFLCGETAEDDGEDLSLGVIWYRYSDPREKSGDGTHTGYVLEEEKCRWNFRSLDADLFEGLRRMLQSRPRAIENLRAYLPSGSRDFAEPLVFTRGRRIDRGQLRENWFSRAATEVAGTELVFFDPDNGMLPKSVKKHYLRGPKYVAESEIARIWERGQSLVIYQHINRSKKSEYQVSEWVGKLNDALSPRGIHALVFKRWSRRVFFVIPQGRVSELLDSRVAAFTHRWSEHFDAQ